MLKNIKKRVLVFSFPLISSLYSCGGEMTIHSILEKGNNLKDFKISSIVQVDKSTKKDDDNGEIFNIKDILERGGESGYVSDIDIDNFSYKSLPPHKGDKILYLTFDDGPMRGTKAVLDVLEKERVEATMFLVASNVVRHFDLFKKELLMPNVMVANHTFSHANGKYSKFYSNKHKVLADVEHAQMLIGGRKYLRLAGRNVWRIPIKDRDDYGIKKRQRKVEHRDYDALKREGFYVYGWDVEWHFDRKGKIRGNAKEMADKVEAVLRRKRTIKEGKVVLLAHDFMFRTKESVKELREFIKIMKNRGWKFQTIDKYLENNTPSKMTRTKYFKPKKLKRKEAIFISARKELEEYIAREKAHQEDILSIRKILASAPLINNTPFVIDNEKLIYSHNIKDSSKSDKKSQKSMIDTFTEAILERDIQKFEALIDNINPNMQDSKGRLAINCAIIIDNMEFVKRLIKKGSRLDIQDANGFTPMALATKYKRFDIVRYLANVISKQGILVAKLD